MIVDPRIYVTLAVVLLVAFFGSLAFKDASDGLRWQAKCGAVAVVLAAIAFLDWLWS